MVQRLAVLALAVLAPWVGATAAEPIRIGQSAALDGPAARLGLGMQRGLQAAFVEVNAAGGVHGRQLVLVSRDDGYEPDRAVSATLSLIEEEAVFCLAGYVGTPTAKAILPIVKDMQVPLVGLFTGAGFLRQPVVPTVFNVRASYDEETEALVASLTGDLGIERIAVFHQDDSFGRVGLSGTTKALAKRGLELAGVGTYPRNTEAVKQAVVDLQAAAPEAIVMVGAYAPIAAFVRACKKAGFEPVFTTISFTGTQATIEALGDQAEGLVISQVMPSPLSDDLPIIAAYRQAMQQQGQEQFDYTCLEGYVTGRVLIAGLQQAEQPLDRAGLVAAMEAMTAVDLGGLSVSFSAVDHQALDQVYLTQVRQGQATPVTAITAP